MKRLKRLSLITILILVLLMTMSINVFAQGESGSVLSSDYDNTFVIKDDGSLWGWGGSYTGNGTGHREPTVAPVKILDNVRSVSSASHSTIAVKKDDEFYMYIEGTTTDEGYTMDLKYDVFYKNADIRIDTSWDDIVVSSGIYNSVDDATYIESHRYTSYAEYTSGNLLPIRLINIDFLERLEIDDEIELFTAQYEMLNNKKVLHIKTNMKNGVTTEMWYSLEYLVPVKFREICIEDGVEEEINWSVVVIDDEPLEGDELFDIPDDAVINNGDANDYYEDTPVNSSTRDLLLYEVSYIDIEEKGLDDMVQIFYYSDRSYETLVEYFKNLLDGTEGYSISVGAEMTAIDGTLNGDTIIVIVNNYKKYESEVGKNGVNINYY